MNSANLERWPTKPPRDLRAVKGAVHVVVNRLCTKLVLQAFISLNFCLNFFLALVCYGLNLSNENVNSFTDLILILFFNLKRG